MLSAVSATILAVSEDVTDISCTKGTIRHLQRDTGV